MGAGGSLEAAYELQASVPAGAYHCIIDSIITRPVDMTFDLIWRRGDTDMVLASWQQHFDPLPQGFDAQPYELDVDAPAIDFMPGDRFVFRYTAGPDVLTSEAWIPNGDGTLADGRIPNFTLPK